MMIQLWGYVEGKRGYFRTSVSPDLKIYDLKKQIYAQEQIQFIVQCSPSDLTLTKVDVDLDMVDRKLAEAGQYQLDTDNQRQLLPTRETISGAWPEPPPASRLHIVVGLPRGVIPSISTQAGTWYKAANTLHKAMWLNDLEEKLLKVDKYEDLKYLPPTEVENLQLNELGCEADAILVHEEYLLTFKEFEMYRPNIGGIVLTGQPGIGKSIFLFYLLLRLLSMGEPVALQRGEFFYIFSQDGVEMHRGDSTGWIFRFKGKLWALSDSRPESKTPCRSFQWFSRQKHAYIVQATSPEEVRWKEWEKECGGRLFAMKCFTEKEAKALSIISKLDVQGFLAHFKKWGPSARTCIRLAHGSLTETRLQNKVTDVAKKFARDPTAINMGALSQDFSHVLFALTPNDDRSDFTSRVTNPYLRSLVMEEVALLDAFAQVSFYHQTSTLPQFRGTWEYMFEAYFLVWLYSTERADALLYTAKSATSAEPTRSSKRIKYSTPTADDQAEAAEPELRLQPLGRENVIVINGDSEFQKARDSNTPFGFLPASRTFPSFDAVICTDKNIITIQLTVSSRPTMKPDDFKRLKHYLPVTFERARTWCHVFVTDQNENAILLLKRNHDVAVEMNISIYSAVLDIPACIFSPEDVKRTFSPSDESVVMDTSGIEVESEEEQQMIMG